MPLCFWEGVDEMANNLQPQRQKRWAAGLVITKLCLELEMRANSD